MALNRESPGRTTISARPALDGRVRLAHPWAVTDHPTSRANHRRGARQTRSAACAALALAIAGAALAPSPAAAIIAGEPVRSSDQIRRWTVKVESSKGELCSGVVLSQRIILTAAHCVIAGGRFTVSALDDRMRRRSIRATHVIAHDSFLPGRTPSTQPGIDLALLRLAEPLAGAIEPVSIGAGMGVGERLTIAGFGLSQEDRSQTARTLRQGNLMSAGSYTSSNSVVVAVDMRNLGKIHGAGACRGDSGGPILRGDGGGAILVGIVSWSSGPTQQRVRRVCGGYTAITPVAPHQGWISSMAATLAALPDEPAAARGGRQAGQRGTEALTLPATAAQPGAARPTDSGN